MSKYSEAFHQEATDLTDRLLGQPPRSDQFSDLEVRDGLYIDDVQQAAQYFSTDAKNLALLGLPFPAVRSSVNRTVPIALDGFAPSWLTRASSPRDFDYLYLDQFVQTWIRSPSDLRTTLTIDEAVSSFRVGLADFLATRIASVAEFFGRPSVRSELTPVPLTLMRLGMGKSPVKTVGFTVDVHTSTSNLRVHVSPTFRRNWRYFSAPTTPTVGVLPGGIYEFGADGGPYSVITPDPGTFDIPYTTVSPRLNL